MIAIAHFLVKIRGIMEQTQTTAHCAVSPAGSRPTKRRSCWRLLIKQGMEVQVRHDRALAISSRHDHAGLLRQPVYTDQWIECAKQ